MPFNNNNMGNEPMGVVNNPLTNSLFVANFAQGGIPIPPLSGFIISENGNYLISEITDIQLITE